MASRSGTTATCSTRRPGRGSWSPPDRPGRPGAARCGARMPGSDRAGRSLLGGEAVGGAEPAVLAVDVAAQLGLHVLELVVLVEAHRLLAELGVVVEAGARGDELADDHVLLEAAQTVDLAGDGRLGEHPGGLLEGGRREPRRGVERRL